MTSRIFISSTSRDLAEHRAAVIETLLDASHIPIVMEKLGSMTGDATAVNIKEIAKADLFIGIYANRYGYRPDDDKSITELEYLEATNLAIPRLIFMIEDDYHHPLVDEYAETDEENIVLFNFFKRRLARDNVRTGFTTPEDLAKKVLQSVITWLDEQSKPKNETSSSINVTGNNSFSIGNISTDTNSKLPGKPDTPYPPRPKTPNSNND